MNAKEADQQACNIDVAGCNAEKEFYFMMPRVCPTAGHRRGHMLDLSWQRKGAWRTKSERMADMGGRRKRRRRGQSRNVAVTWRTYDIQGLEAGRTHGGHKAGTWRTTGRQGLEAGPKRTQGSRRTHGGNTAFKADRQGGQTADTRRTHGGQSVEAEPKRNQGGQWRTHGGQALGTRPEHIAASSFSTACVSQFSELVRHVSRCSLSTPPHAFPPTGARHVLSRDRICKGARLHTMRFRPLSAALLLGGFDNFHIAEF